MANINEILARAAALRDETALNSIDPERAGGIMYDTLIALNEIWLQGSALVISKIYASVAAMEADTSPVSDLTGQPLRPGQIVVIASSDSDNGSIYRYNGTSSPNWSEVGQMGSAAAPIDSLDSDSTTRPLAAHQGKVLDGKISQLGQYMGEIVTNIVDSPTYTVGYRKSDGTTGSSSSYGYTSPILLQPGETIHLNKGLPMYHGSNVAVLYKCDSGGNWIETIIVGHTETKEEAYTNDSASDIYVSICGYNGTGAGNNNELDYYIAVCDKSASHTNTIKGWILNESFTIRSATRDANGLVSSANVTWPDGIYGTLAITRDTEGNATQVVATYNLNILVSYTLTITRDSDGNVTATVIS